jgi:Ca2+-binding RTX toxin-like protein
MRRPVPIRMRSRGDCPVLAMSPDPSDRFFGTVVKAGINLDDDSLNFGSLVIGSSTDNGRNLQGVTNTTLSLDALGIGSIRYPGGSEGQLFDITNPEQIQGLHRAIDFCQSRGLSLNFTLDDQRYIKESGENFRVALTPNERADLQTFIVRDLVGYAASKGVTIESIHIGNEFQGDISYLVGNDKAWLGYAKSSSLIINEVDAILDSILFTSSSDRPSIVIQPPNWDRNSHQVEFLNELKTTLGSDGFSAASKLDAIDLHGVGNKSNPEESETDGPAPSVPDPTKTDTLELTWEDYYGGNVFSSGYELNLQRIMNYWGRDPELSHVEFRNDAWAYAVDPRLQDAALGMLQLHTASKLGFVSVTNYVGYNSDQSALVIGNKDQSSTSVNMTAGGALFSLMSNALKDTNAVTLSNAATVADEAMQTSIIRAFAGDDRAVFYIVSRTAADIDVDFVANQYVASLGGFVGGVSAVNVTILGSSNATSRNAEPTLENISLLANDIYAGETDFVLNGYEIAQITLIAEGIFGSSADDSVVGTGIDDVLHGLNGDDLLSGFDGLDLLIGGNGADTLDGGLGADTIYGGTGNDTADYFGSLSGVSINLQTKLFSGGSAVGDTLFDIENIIGSSFNDTLTGDAGLNLLYGGAGNDLFFYSSGGDQFFGGGGLSDSLVLDDVAATLSLFDGTNTRGIVFQSIENVFGGASNDFFIGSSAANDLRGAAGNDTLLGYGNNDMLSGNAGNDVIRGDAGNDTILSGLGNDQLVGGAGNDQFRYLTPLEGRDVILDFGSANNNDDSFMFRATSFSGLAAGKLATAHFVLQTSSQPAKPLDALDRFIFRTNDKTLWYDADGTGSIRPVLIADLQNSAANLTVNDIWLF